MPLPCSLGSSLTSQYSSLGRESALACAFSQMMANWTWNSVVNFSQEGPQNLATRLWCLSSSGSFHFFGHSVVHNCCKMSIMALHTAVFWIASPKLLAMALWKIELSQDFLIFLYDCLKLLCYLDRSRDKTKASEGSLSSIWARPDASWLEVRKTAAAFCCYLMFNNWANWFSYSELGLDSGIISRGIEKLK